MCTFLSTLPTKSNTMTTAKRQNIFLSLRPCPEDDPKAYYRFRLLNFINAKSKRDSPFLERFVHTRWSKTEDGKPMIESQVICPVTKYVEWDGDRYSTCPICKVAGNAFATWKESGYKDKEAGRKNREFGRKFEALVPVYVVNDPNYEGNNGKLRVISFGDKNDYKKFKELVAAKLREVPVFNGSAAVDFCIRIERVTETSHPGEPNEYTWSHNVIKNMLFSNKPYDIPAINKETVDAFPFDEQYYVSSTKAEIMAFHNKYCKVQMDDLDIPTETVEVFKPASQPAKTTPAVPVANPTPEKKAEETADLGDIDDLLGTSDEKPAEKKSDTAPLSELPMDQSTDDIDVDDLLAGI